MPLSRRTLAPVSLQRPGLGLANAIPLGIDVSLIDVGAGLLPVAAKPNCQFLSTSFFLESCAGCRFRISA